MKEIELLAPAGNLDICKAALNAGADAVYLAGDSFGARAFAKNFTRDEIIEAVNYAHILDKKIFVTVNTLVFNSELEALEDYLDFLYLNNVDGIIVQDLGVLNLSLQKYPNMEVHCSTQMHIHNISGVKELKRQGVDRIVVARETPLELIQEMCREDIDIEVFIHGALCVSYSGQCNFSFQDNGRSANRGSCIQNCRWKYRLQKGDLTLDKEAKHYLSMKDLNTLTNIDELVDAGVKSFKIEGRMKSIDYVVNTVKAYRKKLDQKSSNHHLDKSYNRDFTQGHIFHDTNIVNLEVSEFKGEYVGDIVSFHNNMATVKLKEDLFFNDGIRIVSQHSERGFIVNNMYLDDKLVKVAPAGAVVMMYSQDRISGALYRTSNAQEVEHAEEYIETLVAKSKVSFDFIARVNEPMMLTVRNNDIVISKRGKIVEKAMSQPTTVDRIKKQLGKINDTLFSVNHINVDADDTIFISIKELNHLRRSCIEALQKEKTICKGRHFKGVMMNHHVKNRILDKDLIEVSDSHQLNTLRKFGVNQVIYKEAQENTIYNSGVINEDSFYQPTNSLILNELGNLSHPAALKLSGLGIPITNNYTIDFLIKNGVIGGIVSNEVVDDDLLALYQCAEKTGFNLYRQAYGKIDLMHMKNCPINPKRNKCDLCRRNKYYLKHEETRYHILGDQECIMTVFSDKAVKREPQTNNSNYIRFTDESLEDVEKILSDYKII